MGDGVHAGIQAGQLTLQSDKKENEVQFEFTKLDPTLGNLIAGCFFQMYLSLEYNLEKVSCYNTISVA